MAFEDTQYYDWLLFVEYLWHPELAVSNWMMERLMMQTTASIEDFVAAVADTERVCELAGVSAEAEYRMSDE